MRSLLILTYHFPPSAASGAFRLLGFAQHLHEFGWKVSVVAPPTLPWEPVDPRLADRLPREVRIFAAPYSQAPLTKPLRKLAPYASWLPTAWRKARAAAADVRPDVVLTSGPPHEIHLLGAYARRFWAIPWVADFRDPWVAGRPPQARTSVRGRWSERVVMRDADAIIWNTRSVCEQLRAAYPNAAPRMTAIENGYDPEAYPPRTRRRRGDDPVDVLHAGMVYFGRDPRPFLKAASALSDNRDGAQIRTSFLGLKRDFTVDIQAEASRLGIADRVFVEGHAPYQVTLQRMVDADILLLLDSPGRRMGVPAKLYEYIGAGRPILALAEENGDLADILRASNRLHRIAPPQDVRQIAAALQDLVVAVRSGGGGEQPGGANASRFTRRNLAERLAGVLEHCARRATTVGS